jgi:hypothetical protein
VSKGFHRFLQREKVTGAWKAQITLSVTLAFTWRASKCPGKKKLRTTEWAKWPRNGTELGWSDPTFAHGSVAKLIPGVAPAQQEVAFGARRELGKGGEEGRNYVLQLRLHHLLHLVMRLGFGKTRK